MAETVSGITHAAIWDRLWSVVRCGVYGPGEPKLQAKIVSE